MKPHIIHIDGSMGEGGGQVLRSCLALSLALGRAFCITKIRAGRPRPGLMRQHLACVHAAQAMSNATVSGNSVHSTELMFCPGPLQAGEYHFDVGSGGSVSLVFQAIVPALMSLSRPSRVTVCGGTHVPFAPPFEFMAQSLFPALQRMGVKLRATLERPGFMQVGGGRVTVDVEPCCALRPLQAWKRESLTQAQALIYHYLLADEIALQESAELLSPAHAGLGLNPANLRIIGPRSLPADGSVNMVLLMLRHGEVVTVTSETAKPGRSANEVASRVARQALQHIQSGAAVDKYLADQLLIPMVLAGGGSFITNRLTPHSRTCLDVISQFMDMQTVIREISSSAILLELKPAKQETAQ